jgi:putative ABC transport system ATP-binding protein
MPDPELIRLTGIRKTHHSEGTETVALDGVDLAVVPGEYVAVAGPSGCGKSTLLSILGLLDAPTAGAYLLDGRPVASLGAAERARVRNRDIGFVFQAFNLVGDLTARQNVELPLTYRRGLSAAERRGMAEAALERVGMADRMDHYPLQLSGGQQQRTAVARAIAGRPRLILADEPTGNLDSANGEAVMDLLGELHGEGATLCLVTHDPRYAGHAQRTVHLLDGRVVADGPS